MIWGRGLAAAALLALGAERASADGDVDIFVGLGDGTIKYYQNDGTKSFMVPTEKTAVGKHPFYGVDVGARAVLSCVDIDGDLDYDCFVGESGGTVKYFKNVEYPGHATFVDQVVAETHPFFGVDFGTNAAPFCERDFDGDGDFDCFVGLADGSVVYHKNTGTVTAPVFAAQAGAANPFNGLTVAGNAVLFCFDIDNDSDIDCFVGVSDGTISYFKNTGTATAPAFTLTNGAGNNPFHGVDFGDDAVIRCVDADFDDDMDCFIGNALGKIYYYKNTGTRYAAVYTDFSLDASVNVFFATQATPLTGLQTAPMFADIDASCSPHNHCNGHGTCYPPVQCKCFDGYGSDADLTIYRSPDCSKRVCPAGKSWADVPTTATTAHALAECSDKGMCDRTSGKCACFPGFTGDACQRLACPTSKVGQECSGHGRCQSMKVMATMTNALPLSAATTYTGAEATTTWDEEMSYGWCVFCLCCCVCLPACVLACLRACGAQHQPRAPSSHSCASSPAGCFLPVFATPAGPSAWRAARRRSRSTSGTTAPCATAPQGTVRRRPTTSSIAMARSRRAEWGRGRQVICATWTARERACATTKPARASASRASGARTAPTRTRSRARRLRQRNSVCDG
jgi:hypothetical protein